MQYNYIFTEFLKGTGFSSDLKPITVASYEQNTKVLREQQHILAVC